MPRFEGRDTDTLAKLLDPVLAHLPLTEAGDWQALCPPPCFARHHLSDEMGEHEAGPLFVYNACARGHKGLRTGLIVCGRSNVYPSGEHGQQIQQAMSPRLARIAFSALLSPDIDDTYAGVVANYLPNTSHAYISLTEANQTLHVDTRRTAAVNVMQALIYLS